MAIFTRPSVTHQSPLSLIKTVTGCQVPGVFSHISAPPIFLHTGVCKCPLTLTRGATERQNRPVGLLSAQWTAPVLQILAECHWLISAPRTAPDTRSMSARVQLHCCRAIFSERSAFLKEGKNNTVCHQNSDAAFKASLVI